MKNAFVIKSRLLENNQEGVNHATGSLDYCFDSPRMSFCVKHTRGVAGSKKHKKAELHLI